MNVYSIKDLENLSGIKAHTLRIWEQRYDIISPKRTDTNIRYYDDYDLKLVLNISLLQEHGYKISKIAGMSPDAMHQQVIDLSDQSNRHDDQIQALTIAMVDLDEARFEKIVARCAAQMGFEQTMTQVVYPFLTKIGILWQTGSVNPAQEHFITNLIRQKLIVATDGLSAAYDADCRKYMLFLPSGELHEMSLLFANFLLRARRQRVIYLGQNLPFKDLESVYAVHKPDCIFTVITASPGPDEAQAYINNMAVAFPQATILVSGYQVVSQDILAPENVVIVRKIQDLLDFVDDK